MKRAMRDVAAILVLTAAFVLSGCGSGAPQSGTVVQMDHDDADSRMGTCYSQKTRTEPVTQRRYVGGKWVTTTKMVKRTVSDPYPCRKHDPESFRLRVKNGSQVGWVTVSRDAYTGCRVGSYYSQDGGMCRAL